MARHALRGPGGRFVSAKTWLELSPRTPADIEEAGIKDAVLLEYYNNIRKQLMKQERQLKKMGFETREIPQLSKALPTPAQAAKKGAEYLQHMASKAQSLKASGRLDPNKRMEQARQLLNKGGLSEEQTALAGKIFTALDQLYDTKAERNKNIGSDRVIRLAVEIDLRGINPEKLLSDPRQLEYFVNNVSRMEAAAASEIKPKRGQWASDAWYQAMQKGMI